MRTRRMGKHEAAVVALRPGKSIQIPGNHATAMTVATQYGRTWGREFKVSGEKAPFTVTRVK